MGGRHLISLVLVAVLGREVAAQDKVERSGDTIAFELTSNVIFVEGSMNGTGGLRFIFDTGASVTVVKPATAKKIGLVKEGERVGGFFGIPTFKTAASIGAGKALVRDLPVAVMNVPQADLPFFFQGIHYDGILGTNYISQFLTTLDYKEQTIKLVPNDYVPSDPRDMLKGRRKAEPKTGLVEPAPTVHVGIAYATIEDDVANEIGVEGGVVVKSVAPESPAARGGLKKGDIIQEINGKRVDRAEDYRKVLAGIKPGETLKFSVIRDRKDIDVEVVTTERE